MKSHHTVLNIPIRPFTLSGVLLIFTILMITLIFWKRQYHVTFHYDELSFDVKVGILHERNLTKIVSQTGRLKPFNRSTKYKKKFSNFIVIPQNLNVSVPPSKNYSLGIYIRCAPSQLEIRQAVRKTWAAEAKKLGITTLFIMGLPKTSESLTQLNQELNTYRDLLIFTDFVDDYHNLSLKTRDMLRWHVENTPENLPNMLFWANVDTIVYPRNLLTFIDFKKVLEQEGTMYGVCTCNGECGGNGPEPFRQVGDKWYMSYEVWPQPYYPHHCIGFTILMSPKTSKLLLNSLANFPWDYAQQMWIDDVLYTGILAQDANMSIQSYPQHFFVGEGPRTRKCKEPSSDLCVGIHLHGGTSHLMEELWNYTKL